jgi:hypothetical protein
LCEAELKSEELVNMTEEIPRQPSIQAVAWLVSDAFIKFALRIVSREKL